jgi:predicted dehydrogenase
MTRAPRIGLVGTGGYGAHHLANIDRLQAAGRLQLVATVSRHPDPARARGARNHATLAEMLESERLDIVVLATPIPVHPQGAIAVMTAGVHVLLEKPPAVTMPDLMAMLEVQRSSGTLCQVGFQSAGSQAVAAIRKLIRSGELGDDVRVVVRGTWRRGDRYYRRNGWAGRLEVDGRYVLDGTLTNPFAHGLMQALLVLAASNREVPIPFAVQAELYRAHPIEGDDTASVRVETGGWSVLLALTLCARRETRPTLITSGSRARASLRYQDDVLQVVTLDGGRRTIERYARTDLLEELLEVSAGRSESLSCDLATTAGFVATLHSVAVSAGRPVQIPSRHVRTYRDGDEEFVHVAGIEKVVRRAGASARLFSELGVPWAEARPRVEVAKAILCPPLSSSDGARATSAAASPRLRATGDL